MRILGGVFGCVLAMGIWIGCSDKAPVSSYQDEVAPAFAAKKGGKAGKVDVCHVTGNGGYVKINVSTNALPAHLGHGDLLPGEGGLDENCQTGAPVNKIVFYSNRDGDHEVYIMDSDGSNQTNVTNNPSENDGEVVGGHPRLSPDGTKILYTNYGADPLGDLFVIAADGSGSPTNLTNDPASLDSNADWSPDGSQIVWAKDNRSVWVMNADGSMPGEIATGGAGWPSWSPDGSQITFTKNVDIWVMDANGDNPINLTSNGVLEWDSEWSPDGTLIAFEGTEDFVDVEVYVMNADGTGPITNLTPEPGWDAWPAWSPDGRIVYTSGESPWAGIDPRVEFDIWIMDADGTNKQNLTQVDGDDSWPSWY